MSTPAERTEAARRVARADLAEAVEVLDSFDALWPDTQIGDDDTIARHLHDARTALRDALARYDQLTKETR